MKQLFVLIILGLVLHLNAQPPSAGELVGIHVVTTSEMNTITDPIQGTLVFNSTRKSIFQYDGDSWTNLNPESTVGKFIISTTGNQSISGLTFSPSRVIFHAFANVESYDLNSDNGVSNNHTGLANSFGYMKGFAKKEIATISQQVICGGGSGNSINDISRYASSSQCIGVRYGNQNGDSLGTTTASLTSFNSDGFTINVNSKADNLVVIYEAYE